MTEINRKEMLAGLFLSKFDLAGLRELGFTNWNEAYNALALSVNGRPLSVKGCCGFDFKLTPPSAEFLGVEVKGMSHSKGQIMLTEKEFKMAGFLKQRFYLYVVSNFSHTPKPIVVENPLSAS